MNLTLAAPTGSDPCQAESPTYFRSGRVRSECPADFEDVVSRRPWPWGSDLIAEVAASTVGYDLGMTLDAFAASGVRESVVRRVLDCTIDR